VDTLLQQHKNHAPSVICLLDKRGNPKADNHQIFAKQLTDAITTVTMERPDNTKTSDWKHNIETRLSLRQDCKPNGTAISCSCCFNEFTLEEMVACREEGHLFCTDCVANYAENQIFGAGNFGTDRRTKKPAMELLCMHADECSSGFPLAQLQKALYKKVCQVQ
jgi:hypothetical protein